MSSRPLITEVFLDGELIADDRVSFYDGATTALTGLKVSWGRKTSLDQPTPSAITLRIAQRQGRADFLRTLKVGKKLDIYATGTLYPDADQPAFLDPGFDLRPAGSAPNLIVTNGTALVDADLTAPSQPNALYVTAVDALQRVRVIFPPAPFSSRPNAWDSVPATSVNEQWEVGASHRANPGAHVTVTPVLFPRPDGVGYQLVTAAAVSGDGADDWAQLSTTFIAAERGDWVGVCVDFDSIGPRWVDMPSTQDWTETPGTWLDYVQAEVDDLVVLEPAAGVQRTVLVFDGRVTDQEAQWSRSLADGTLLVDITGRDVGADLANDRIGDDPWPVQSLEDRVERILDLASTNSLTAQVDASIGGTLVSYRDVDSQPVAGLISELAASVASVAWLAVHETEGPYYWIEDPSNRVALLMLTLNPDTGYVDVETNPNAPTAIEVASKNVLEEPLRWVQNVSDISTRVNVTWLEQGVDDDGKPTTTERHVVVIDPQLETEYGQRSLSLSTQLQAQADAQQVATRLIGRTTDLSWHVDDVTWRTGLYDTLTADEINAALDLLDGTQRIGHAIKITQMPPWSPGGSVLAAYIEGGEYTVDDGAWELALTISSGGSQGQSIQWVQADPGWTWLDMEPTLTWADLIGVGPAPSDMEGTTP